MSFLAGLYDPVGETLYDPDVQRYLADTESRSGLTAVYDYEALGDVVEANEVFQGDDAISRFLPILPLKKGIDVVSGNLSATPVKTEQSEVTDCSLFLKFDFQHPSGSIWDRGSVVALSLAREWELTRLLLGTTGPASRSLIHFSRANDFEPYLMMGDPNEEVPKAFSSTRGIYWDQFDGDFKKLIALVQRYEMFLGIPGWNPYFMEGLKTAAFEIVDQLPRVPDWIYVGTESTLVVQSLEKGFRELQTLEWIDQHPEIVQVTLEKNQTKNNSSMSTAPGDTTRDREAETILSPGINRPRRLALKPDDLEDPISDYRGRDRSLDLGLVAVRTDGRVGSDETVCVLAPGGRKLADARSKLRSLELSGDVNDLPSEFPDFFFEDDPNDGER